MSIRPPFPTLSDTLRLASHYSSNLSNSNSVGNINQIPPVHNAFGPRFAEGNTPSHTLFPGNNFYPNGRTSSHQSLNVPYRFAGFVNSNHHQMPVTASPPSRISLPINHFYPTRPINQPVEQNSNMHPLLNHFEHNSAITTNSYQKGFSSPMQNVSYGNLPGFGNYGGYQNNAYRYSVHDASGLQNTLTTTGNTKNIVSSSDNINNPVMFSENSSTLPSTLLNSGNLLSPQLQNSCTFPVPPPTFKSDTSYISLSNNLQNTSSKKEVELYSFLSTFSNTEEKKGSQITVPEFRSVLKAAFSLMKLLSESKCKLTSLLEADENEWNMETHCVSNQQKQLTEICSLISAPVHLNAVMKKLKIIKKKRELRKKTKLNQLSRRIKMEQNRKERNQEIDKYLDDIKEKDLKLKREAEMKKEADYILLEVRKKIHEAKRTIEKIKVFEKLRNARQANAVQKGLHILPDHNEKFEKKIACLKETMLKQLADYEAEEKALKVMLETEQEGQLEEETQWKLKKAKTLQQIKKNHIKECLFGNSEVPVHTDPLFLFHNYHTSANNNIENLVQIRHHWDVHIAEDGEAVPQHWVIPVTPSNSSWEQFLTTSITSRN